MLRGSSAFFSRGMSLIPASSGEFQVRATDSRGLFAKHDRTAALDATGVSIAVTAPRERAAGRGRRAGRQRIVPAQLPMPRGVQQRSY